MRGKEIPNEKKIKIYIAYGMGMGIKEAANYAKVGNLTIIKYWKQAGLESHIGGKRLFDAETLEKLSEAYQYGLSVSEAAEHAAVDKKVVRKYWRTAGLKQPRLPTNFITHESLRKIVEAHKMHMNISEAARYACVNPRTLRLYWNILGFEPTSPYPTHSQEIIDKVIEAHKMEFSTEAAAKYAGVTPHYVTKYWTIAGLKPYNKLKIPSTKISNNSLEKLIEAHTKGMDAIDAAVFADVSTTTVKKYWKTIIKSEHKQQRALTLDKIIEAYNKRLTADEAANYANTNVQTIENIWRAKYGRTAPKKIDKILEGHSKGLSIPQIMKYANASRYGVELCLRSRNLKKNPGRVLSPDQVQKIFEAHSKSMTRKEAAKYAGVSAATIGNYWNTAGLTSHRCQQHTVSKNKGVSTVQKQLCKEITSQEDIENIIEAHNFEKADFRFSEETLDYQKLENQRERKRRGKEKMQHLKRITIPTETKKVIENAIKDGKTLNEIAELTKLSEVVLIKKFPLLRVASDIRKKFFLEDVEK